MLVTLLGVSVVIFVVLRLLPGDAVSASLGVSEGLLSPAQHAELDRYYGIGQPAAGVGSGTTQSGKASWSTKRSLKSARSDSSTTVLSPTSSAIGPAPGTA